MSILQALTEEREVYERRVAFCEEFAASVLDIIDASRNSAAQGMMLIWSSRRWDPFGKKSVGFPFAEKFGNCS